MGKSGSSLAQRGEKPTPGNNEIYEAFAELERGVHAETLKAKLELEAINLAAERLGRESEQGVEHAVLSTILEHTSNDLPIRFTPHSEPEFCDQKKLA